MSEKMQIFMEQVIALTELIANLESRISVLEDTVEDMKKELADSYIAEDMKKELANSYFAKEIS